MFKSNGESVAIKELVSFTKTIALISITIVFAAYQLDEKLIRFEKKFDTITQSITELNTTMKELTRKIDDGAKRAEKNEKEIQKIKAHVGLKIAG